MIPEEIPAEIVERAAAASYEAARIGQLHGELEASRQQVWALLGEAR